MGWGVSAILGAVVTAGVYHHVIAPAYAWILGGAMAFLIGVPLSLLAANRVVVKGDHVEQHFFGFACRRRASSELVRMKWTGFFGGLGLHFSDSCVMRFPFVTQSVAESIGLSLSLDRRRSRPRRKRRG